MERLFLHIYDYLQRHRILFGGLLLVCLALFLWQASSLQYKEDISDFLPVDEQYKKSMQVYQSINAGDKIFLFIAAKEGKPSDADSLIYAAERFTQLLQENDTRGVINDISAEIDFDKHIESIDFVYRNIPYFLTEEEYDRLESLCATNAHAQLQTDKELLMLPTGGMLSDNIARDPLNLFTPTVERVMRAQMNPGFELYDGHIFTPDYQSTLITITSPYGASETQGNAYIVETIEKCIDQMREEATITYIGNSSVAVSNANRIKTDSIWTVIVAVIGIALILGYYFRSLRNILLIVLAISFGWLFALAGIATTNDHVSIIVIGIASVIIGIAVNYPLHYLAHLKHDTDTRSALKELVKPLLIGNITTVAAFCTLIPLDSTALRDLGIFSAMMLVGTIAFVLLFLPHLAARPKIVVADEHLQEERRNIPYGVKCTVMAIIALLTLLLAYYSTFSSFDTNMQHINYITDEQKALFASLRPEPDGTSQLYLISEGENWDIALQNSEKAAHAIDALGDSIVYSTKSLADFVSSRERQQQKIERWNAFIARKSQLLNDTLPRLMTQEGFAAGAFDEFFAIVNGEYQPKEYEEFYHALSQNLSALSVADSGSFTAINLIILPTEKLTEVKAQLNKSLPDSHAFDIPSLNGTISQSLSDNFNYIGWACALIVFLFLCLSFGRIETACIAFLPMAVSWLWILGIMYLLNIQFNIVNIILATFIFGQGDDYAIFMTEGLMHEYTYRKKVLKSYRTSIMLSAAIMFIGIGVLIFAKHPALHSLAQVTLVGMGTVIVMTYLLPPVAFGWLTSNMKTNEKRPYPITLKNGLITFIAYAVGLTKGQSWGRRLLPCIQWNITGIEENITDTPQLILCNHSSPLTRAVIGSVIPHAKIVLSNEPIEQLIAQCRDYTCRGYNIVILTESTSECNYATAVAQALQMNISPLYIHGLSDIMPCNSSLLRSGRVTIEMGKPLSSSALCERYIETYNTLRNRQETPRYFAHYIIEAYTYKSVEAEARRLLRKHDNFEKSLAQRFNSDIIIINNGIGVVGLLTAWINRDRRVYAFDSDEINNDIATLLPHLPKNMTIVRDETALPQGDDYTYILYTPTQEQRDRYQHRPNIIIL